MKYNQFFVITIISLIIFSIGLLGLYSQPEIAPETPTTMPIKVMTYNIHQAYTPDGILDLVMIGDTIKNSEASIVGLQESDTARFTSGNVDAVKYLAEKLNMYSFYGPATSEHTYGVSLLSKFPIYDVDIIFLPSVEDQRVCIEVELEVSDTTRLIVLVTHLGLSWEDRTTQAEKVMVQVWGADPRWPVVLMGDFNTLPTGDPEPGSGETRKDSIYTNITQTLQDCWTGAGHPLNSKDGFTWDATNPSERIDYIFVSPEITINNCFVMSYKAAPGSDHLPVVAEIWIS